MKQRLLTLIVVSHILFYEVLVIRYSYFDRVIEKEISFFLVILLFFAYALASLRYIIVGGIVLMNMMDDKRKELWYIVNGIPCSSYDRPVFITG